MVVCDPNETGRHGRLCFDPHSHPWGNMTTTDCRADLRRALCSADWARLHPVLASYTARRLRRAGWREGTWNESSVLSVDQVIGTVVQRCLEGRRRWNPGNVDLIGLLRGAIRSVISAECARRHRAAQTVAALTVRVEQEPSREDTLIDEETRAEALSRVIASGMGDADTARYLQVALHSNHMTRKELAARLGWTPQRVSRVRRRLLRRTSASMQRP